MQTYHQILGVTLRASQEEIRQNYLELARTFHPDKHVGKSEKELRDITAVFADVTQAYSVLSDPVARRKYETAQEILTDACKFCNGDGHRQRGFSRRVPCGNCGGTGRIARSAA